MTNTEGTITVDDLMRALASGIVTPGMPVGRVGGRTTHVEGVCGVVVQEHEGVRFLVLVGDPHGGVLAGMTDDGAEQPPSEEHDLLT